jgi:chromosome segregation ATPase
MRSQACSETSFTASRLFCATYSRPTLAAPVVVSKTRRRLNRTRRRRPPSRRLQGDWIEARLKSAGTIIANYFRRIGELTSQLATANTQREKLEGQFNAAAGDLTKEKDGHKKTVGDLASANTTIAGLTKERDDANGNVARLEKLCSLRGIDASAAVPVPPENAGASTTGAAKWEKYNELKDQERKGLKPAGAAMAYWRENKKALDDYAASKRVAA